MSWLGELIEKNSSDPRERLELGQQLLAQLQTTRLPTDSTLLNDFCDLVEQWLSASNYKVALLAVEIVDVAMEVSGDILAPYLLERVTALVERLGDSKQSVRDAATQLLSAMSTSSHCSTQVLVEKISLGLVHRQWLVRTGVMHVLRNVLDQQKNQVEAQINRLIPTLCKLMGDPNAEVRDAAASTLVNVFFHYGERIPASVHKRQLIPESKFQMLMARYNDIQQGGGLAPSAPSTSRTARPVRRPLVPQKPSFTSSAGRPMRRGAPSEEQENNSTGAPAWQRASSVPAHKRSMPVTAKNTGTAGAVNDETFRKSFADVPKCDIFSIDDLKEKTASVRAALENTNTDWDRRVTALKTIRGMVIGGGMEFGDFAEVVRELEMALFTSVKDLRSQVCREACVTIAFLCEKLEGKVSTVMEAVVPVLITLLQNSAKVMATSAQVALHYVVKYVRSPKLLIHLQNAMSSKSREIRRYSASVLLMALSLWDSRIVEKNMSVFLDCIKSGLSDADPETRNTSRHLFVALDQDYKPQADMLYKTLDPAKQRALSGYVSQSSSSQSIVSEKDSLPMSQRSSSYSLHGRGMVASPFYSGRSASEIDTMAAQRASSGRGIRSTSHKYGGVPLQQVNGTPLSHTRSTTTPHFTPNGVSKGATPATRRNIVPPSPINVVRSQPGSRSTSPTSRTAVKVTGRPNVTPGRMLQRSHTDDFEDNASASNDSLRFETAELANALACCSSTASPMERKEGLKALFAILSKERQISPHDLKKIVEKANMLLGEGSHKLLQPLTDVLSALIRFHHAELGDWLNQLIPKLVTRQATDLLGSNQDKYRNMLEVVRQYFDREKQMVAVCKFIQDPIRNNVSVKIKQGLLNYLYELLLSMEPGPSINQSEIRQAVNKMFQWSDDPKSTALLGVSEKIVCAMFHLNPSDMTSMLATYSNDLHSRLQAIIRKDGLDSPRANGYSENDAHAGILQTTAQINEFVEGRSVMPTSPLRGSPQLINNGFFRQSLENGGSRRGSREDGIPRRASRGDDRPKPGLYVSDWTELANDPVQQDQLLEKISNLLSHHNDRSQERLRGMAILSQIIRDNVIPYALWEARFSMILFVLVETIKDNEADIRKMALKLLKELCNSQANRFNLFAEMVLIRVLAATTDEAKQVVAAAEECLNVLATHVSSATSRSVLLAVIKSNEAEPKIYMAVKMLTKVIDSLNPDELENILDEVAPPIVDAYNYESSSIRKESVACLVTMYKIVGEERMAPYVSKLNKGKVQLLSVYLKRLTGATTTF